MKLVITIFCGVLSCVTFGQFIRGPINYPSAGVLDGVYVTETIPTKKLVSYTPVREADVTWSKRVWSAIDLREKFNLPLYYPLDDIQENIWNRNSSNWSLWTIIRYSVLNGDLTAYSPFNPNWEDWKDGDQFKYPILPSFGGGNFANDSVYRERLFGYIGREEVDPFAVPLVSLLDPTVDSVVYDSNGAGYTVYPPNDTTWYLSQDIVEYHIKEDVFFDKSRSVLDRRIIGIAPVVYSRASDGSISGKKELFWLYFPECRYVFQNFYLQNQNNTAGRMSLDDMFWKHMFHSYIIKESNMFGRGIEEYAAGVDALLESDRIKNKVNNFESDLWEY